MKTLKLTRDESTAYSNGERRFWRAMKPQPPTGDTCGGLTTCLRDIPETDLWYLAYEADHRENFIEYRPVPQYSSERWRCPYGTTGDRIELAERDCIGPMHTITSITVEQRGSKLGWVVEVGA